MNGRITGSIALAAFVLLGGASALAQDTPAVGAPVPGTTPTVSAPVDSATPAVGAPASSATPAASAAPAKAGPVVTGYAYREHPGVPMAAAAQMTHHHARLVHHANEAIAKVSGFEMLADGGSRLFVQLSRQVDVDQGKDTAPNDSPRRGRHGHAAKQAPRAALTRLTYVLKGTELARTNDENSLETMHFNTPVVRARLTPSGRDLRFVILMRADVTPTMKVVPAKDNGAMLQIDFPQGSYVKAGMNPPEADTKEPVNGALPSPASQGAPSDSNGPGETNDSMGPQ